MVPGHICHDSLYPLRLCWDYDFNVAGIILKAVTIDSAFCSCWCLLPYANNFARVSIKLPLRCPHCTGNLAKSIHFVLRHLGVGKSQQFEGTQSKNQDKDEEFPHEHSELEGKGTVAITEFGKMLYMVR